MKKRIFTAVLLCLLCACGRRSAGLIADNVAALESIPDPESRRMEKNSTPLEFEPRVADLGVMNAGQSRQTEFRIRNTADKAAVIRDVSVSCGCTRVEWPRSPLMPGDEAVMRVNFNAEQGGVFFKKIFVFVAGCRQPVSVAIKGTVNEPKN